jgi:uncharacterized protein (DUF433 family)
MSRSDRPRKTPEETRRGVKRRRGEPKVLTTLRLRRSLRDDLVTAAERSRRSVADVAQELLEEGLRMRLCPGIYFADEPSGRTAKVGGTGLGVWEVLRDFCRDKDLAALGQAFSELSQAQLTAALMYYRRYPEEIQRQVHANARLTPEVLEKEFPGLVRFISVE